MQLTIMRLKKKYLILHKCPIVTINILIIIMKQYKICSVYKEKNKKRPTKNCANCIIHEVA